MSFFKNTRRKIIQLDGNLGKIDMRINISHNLTFYITLLKKTKITLNNWLQKAKIQHQQIKRIPLVYDTSIFGLELTEKSLFSLQNSVFWRYNRDIRYPNFLTIRYIDTARYRDISIFSIYRTALASNKSTFLDI